MGVLVEYFDLFVDGFLVSLQVIAVATVGSLVLGTAVAACRVSPSPPLQAVGTAYVTIFRNAPLTVVLFFLVFAVPQVGINGTFFALAVTGLVLYTAAFVCEALRAGINSVSAGQAEAARALGLGFGATLRQVVLPQAFRTSIPPVGSVLIAMFKNSAVLGAFGVGGDLFSVGVRLNSSLGLAPLPVFTGVAVGYLAITLPAGALLAYLERRTAVVR